MRYPTANPQIRSHCKGIFNRLASPSFYNSPDAACSAHSGNRQNTGVFPKSPILFPKPCDAAQRRKTRCTQTALTPLARDCPRQYFYSLPNGKRTSRERTITHAKFRRQGSASLKIRNGPKGAHGAGGDGAPTPNTAKNRLCQNAKYKKSSRPAEAVRGKFRIPKKSARLQKNEPRERFAFGRFGNRPACATAAAMGMPFHCRRTFVYGRLMPHMQAAPPPKPDGIRRGAESGRPASCRISIPAEPTTASSG